MHSRDPPAAYETFSEVLTSSSSARQNHRDKTNDDDGARKLQSREKPARDFVKKSDLVDKINGTD